MRRFAAVVVLALLTAATPARAADGESQVTRFGGGNRYETSAALALSRFATSSDVLLARGDDPSDGLAANYPAGGHAAPVLISTRDSVPPVVLDAMRTLQVRTVHLMGGDAALSKGLELDLRNRGYQVDRYAGRDRYETAAIAAQANGIGNAGRPALPQRTALLAAGDRPSDALVTGPLAWWSWPLLLTTRDAVPQVTLDVFARHQITHAVIVGGLEAVGSGVEAQLRARGISTERVSGPTREATAIAVADLMRSIGFLTNRIGVAASSSAADALSLGAHVAPDSPILLCRTATDCGTTTLEWIRSHADEVDQIDLAGGEEVVGAAAQEQLRQAAG
jgi:putative cell wall-binding protein